MKKIFSAMMVVMLGLSLVACKKEAAPEEETSTTTAPTLGAITGCVLSNAGEDITTTYTAADFGAAVTINYGLYVDKAGNNMASKVFVKSTAANGTLTVKPGDLNNSIIKLGYDAQQEASVEFCLYAYVGSALNASALASNIVSAKFTTCVAETVDYETYKYIYAIGNFNSWSFETTPGDGVQQYLYDYSNSGVYEGTLYFGGTAHTGWKLSGVTGAWDDSCNWGFSDSGEEQYWVGTEPSDPITLQCSGGSKDMKAWARNFYVFSFDKNTLALSVKQMASWGSTLYPIAFDYMMLTGTFCNWGETTADGGIKMNYDPVKHRFYGDVTLAEGDEIKCFAPNTDYDNYWRLQWGDGCGDGCGNIKITEAGNYRVYLDINKDEFTLSQETYGTEEAYGITEIPDPVILTPEPSVWTVVGSFNGWPDEGDTAADTYTMTQLANHEYVYYGLELSAGAEIKVRGDYAWDESYGAADGSNVVVTDEGTYDIFFNYDDHEVYAKMCHKGWSAIGEIGGYTWTKDFDLYEGESGVWTSDPIVINGEFKLRYRHSWDTNVGADNTEITTVEIGTPCASAESGVNFTVPESGTYKVIYDANNNTVTVSTAYPSACYMIGNDFGNWDWSRDGVVELTPVWGTAGQFWCIRYMKTSTEFKFCSTKAWSGDFCTLDNNVGFTTPNNDMVAADGLYMVFVDFTTSTITVEPAVLYGIGGCFDDSWTAADENYKFTVADGNASVTTVKSGEIRMYAAAPTGYSIDWWKMEFVFFDGKIAYRGNDGDQERVTVEGGKTVTLDFNAGTASVN